MNAFNLIKEVNKAAHSVGVVAAKIITTSDKQQIIFHKKGEQKQYSLSANTREELFDSFLKHKLIYGE